MCKYKKADRGLPYTYRSRGGNTLSLYLTLFASRFYDRYVHTKYS